jgi:signal transduction histidine kinase
MPASAHVPVGALEPARATDAPGDVRDLLLRISREMASASSVDEILQTMADAALRIAPSAEKCVIHLLDAPAKRLVPRVCSHPWPDGLGGAGIPADMGIAGRALRERQTLCVADTAAAADFAPLNPGSSIQSLLVAPLYVAELPLGTLSLSSSHTSAFGSDETQHIRTLSAQASVVIRQARLLRESIAERQLSEAIIQSLADGLVILDAQGRVQRLNPAAYDLAMLREPLSHSSPPREEGECSATLRALLDAGGEVVGPYEMSVTLSSGRAVTLNVTPSVLPPPAEGQVRIIRDVTAERQARREVYAFISQVAHELRTPLQHILSFTGLLREIPDLADEQRQELLTNTQTETENLSLLVDDLLQLARFEQGRFVVRKQRTRLDQLVSEQVAKFRQQAESNRVLLDVQVQPDIWSLTDGVRLGQVLANVITNALRYVPEGGRIAVALAEVADHAQVSVADTGPGMSPEVLAHIFEPFYQGSQGNSVSLGVGLGLSISQQIMAALGGSIRADSRLGEGSTFYIEVPCLPHQQ